MTMQSEHHQAGFLQSAAGQSVMLAAVLVVVLAVAWIYVF
jgi:hypothetical protein